jgi:carbonic anhydrase
MKMPTTHLQALVSEIRRSVAKLSEPSPGEALIEAAIRATTHRIAANLLERSSLLRRFVTSGELSLIEAEYVLETGKVIRLSSEPTTDFAQEPRKMRKGLQAI